MTWADLTVAGAFIAGAISGGAATIWLSRFVFDYLKAER